MGLLSNEAAIASAHYLHRGIAHFNRGHFEHAIAAYDIALRLNPDCLYARWNRATALLSLGDYARGFVEHDVAWRLFDWRGFAKIGDVTRLKDMPLWRGEANVRVLAYHELGFGDAIMAMRYLPAIQRCADVLLVCDPVLHRLARRFDVVVTRELPDDLAGFDYRLPFFGVMAALQQTEATIPTAPYLAIAAHADPKAIGIAWSGRTQTEFSAQAFLARLAHDGYTLHALQPGPTPANVEPLAPGADFADTAERVARMGHVVSVDTAAIHLAGAMGHPSAHLLLPFVMDWRWWRPALWYPALKTYRQEKPDDWRAPFERVNAALHP